MKAPGGWLLRRALAIDEAAFGAEHPDVASLLTSLAQLLQDTSRLAESEPLKRHALAIDAVSFGADHPKVARHFNNLAQLLQATNRPAEAEPLMYRVLALIEQSFGEDFPSSACRTLTLLLAQYAMIMPLHATDVRHVPLHCHRP